MNKKGRVSKAFVLFITGITAVLALFCAAGVTTAFLKDDTEPVKNTFTPGSVIPEIEEEFDGYDKKSVKIKNTGNSAAYIRAAVIGNTLATGSAAQKEEFEHMITGPFDVRDNLNVKYGAPSAEELKAGCWFEKEGYYYWSLPVDPGEYTGELIKKDLPVKIYEEKDGQIIINRQVTVLSEAIQAKGADSNCISPVEKAWGISCDYTTGVLSGILPVNQ